MIPICHLSVYSVHPLKSKRIKQNMLGWYQSINMFFLNLASGKFSTYFMFFIYHVSSFVCMFVMLIDLHTIKDFKKAFVFSHTGLKTHSHLQLNSIFGIKISSLHVQLCTHICTLYIFLSWCLNCVRCSGWLVSVELHAGGDWWPAHLLHGGERAWHYGRPLPVQGTLRAFLLSFWSQS